MRRRLLARYYTGPVGHFVAGVADWATLLARWKASQAIDRFKRARRGRSQGP